MDHLYPVVKTSQNKHKYIILLNNRGALNLPQKVNFKLTNKDFNFCMLFLISAKHYFILREIIAFICNCQRGTLKVFTGNKTNILEHICCCFESGSFFYAFSNHAGFFEIEK